MCIREFVPGGSLATLIEEFNGFNGKQNHFVALSTAVNNKYVFVFCRKTSQ